MLIPSMTYRQPGFAVSLVLHLLALAGLIWLVRPPPLPKVVQQAISVELVAMLPKTESKPSTEAAPVATAPGDTATETGDSASRPPEPEMIHATKMLASVAFSDPRNTEAREMLGQLDDTTRREQLCGVEAMEQISAYKPAWHPEWVVAHAREDALVEGNVMTADGAAVRIAGQWREMRFICALTPDLTSVTAFDFWIGDVLTPKEVNAYNLAIDNIY